VAGHGILPATCRQGDPLTLTVVGLVILAGCSGGDDGEDGGGGADDQAAVEQVFRA
jgi:hypothetical protein